MPRPSVLPDWATNANYGAGPYPGNPNKAQPPSGIVQEGFDPSSQVPAEWLNWILNNHATWLDSLDLVAASLFGDGSDGTVTLGGGTTTLTRDMFYANLAVPNGSVLHTNGFRVYVRGLLNITGSGVISCDGTPGTSGGTATNVGTLLGGAAGHFNPTAGDNAANSYGGAGGAGGGAGSAGGTATVPPANLGAADIFNSATAGYIAGLASGVATLTAFTGGAGGGGGVGGGGAQGGGGAGVLAIIARKIQFASAAAIHANGGVGGSTVVAASGGGGGGGGGVIFMATADDGGFAAAYVGSANTNGGAGGTGPGGNGVAGGGGSLFFFNLG